MRILALFILLSCLLGASGQDGPDWFTLEDSAAESWELEPLDRDTRIGIKAKTPLEGTTYKVMALFPKKSSAYDIAMAQILNEIREKNISAQFMLVFFGGDLQAGKQALADAESAKMDIILSMGSQSTSFVNQHYRGGSIPVVTVCSKDPVLMGLVENYESGGKSNIAFTSLDVPTRNQLAYLRQLNKDLSQIAILYARNNVSAVETQVQPLIAACEKEGIRILEVVVENQENARAELAEKMPLITAQIIEQDPQQEQSIFWITGSTSVFREIETINAFSQRIPVLSAVPNVVKPGDNSAVLSIGVSFENNAQLAALYTIRILTRQVEAGDLPVGLVSPPDIAINFKKARAIGLKIPFSFFESAGFIYDHHGELVREKGQNIAKGKLQ